MWRALSNVLSAAATIGIFTVAYLMYHVEIARDERTHVGLALEQIESHKLRLNEVGTAFVCARALLNFPANVRHATGRFRGSPGQDFQCSEEWCPRYRRCVGATADDVPDGSSITITETLAWEIVLPIHAAIESYESLSHLACSGAIDTTTVVDRLRIELHRDNAVLEYFQETRSGSRLPQKSNHGLQALIGHLYPSEHPEWAGHCPATP